MLYCARRPAFRKKNLNAYPLEGSTGEGIDRNMKYETNLYSQVVVCLVFVCVHTYVQYIKILTHAVMYYEIVYVDCFNMCSTEWDIQP